MVSVKVGVCQYACVRMLCVCAHMSNQIKVYLSRAPNTGFNQWCEKGMCVGVGNKTTVKRHLKIRVARLYTDTS